MAIQDICSKNVQTITKDKNLSNAAQLMKEQNVGTLIVVDRENACAPIGILTDRDIALYLTKNVDLRFVPVTTVMNKKIVTAQEGTGIFEVLRSMNKKHVNRMPIINQKGELSGVISSDDILELVAGELSELAHLRKPNTMLRPARNKRKLNKSTRRETYEMLG